MSYPESRPEGQNVTFAGSGFGGQMEDGYFVSYGR